LRNALDKRDNMLIMLYIGCVGRGTETYERNGNGDVRKVPEYRKVVRGPGHGDVRTERKRRRTKSFRIPKGSAKAGARNENGRARKSEEYVDGSVYWYRAKFKSARSFNGGFYAIYEAKQDHRIDFAT